MRSDTSCQRGAASNHQRKGTSPMAAKELITAELVRELMTYEAETGHLRWRQRMSARVHAGCVAGCKCATGYLLVRIHGTSYPAHRLAWLWMTGQWPKQHLDHRNRDKTDNRWDNLREASPSQNQANMKRAANNTSGLKGVSWRKRVSMWQAAITVRGKTKWLGYFSCKAAAHFSYQVAASKYFGEFARAA